MLKVLFRYLTDSYALLENPVDNYIIMGTIGIVAFLIAYKREKSRILDIVCS